MDCAIELHLYAGRPRAALALITQRLSDALPGSLTSTAKGAPTSYNALEHGFEVIAGGDGLVQGVKSALFCWHLWGRQSAAYTLATCGTDAA